MVVARLTTNVYARIQLVNTCVSISRKFIETEVLRVMQCIDKVQLPLLAWNVFKETDPNVFCEKWVPLRDGFKKGERGYRKAAQQLLADVCGIEVNSANMWLSKPDRVTPLARKYLTAVDIIWSSQQTYNEGIDK
ncbi:MAG: hypothetical protein AAF959_05200 [Cyanobacteria bacterium P01_D01_bin.56]